MNPKNIVFKAFVTLYPR